MNYIFKITDDGKIGKEFECSLKEEFGCIVKVAKPSQTDLVKYVDGVRTKFECKTGSGEIKVLDEFGNVVKDITSSDYIIYRATITSETYVMKSDEFLRLVEDNDLLRYKFTTEMNKVKKSGGNWYYDRVTLKTIDDKTSHCKRDFINNLLEENAITLDEFIASHKIRIA